MTKRKDDIKDMQWAVGKREEQQYPKPTNKLVKTKGIFASNVRGWGRGWLFNLSAINLGLFWLFYQVLFDLIVLLFPTLKV